MPGTENEKVSEAVERQLPADLALLLASMRAEFQAKNEALYSKLMTRLLVLGVPVGAIGGFTAELVKPGGTARVVTAILPFV